MRWSELVCAVAMSAVAVAPAMRTIMRALTRTSINVKPWSEASTHPEPGLARARGFGGKKKTRARGSLEQFGKTGGTLSRRGFAGPVFHRRPAAMAAAPERERSSGSRCVPIRLCEARPRRAVSQLPSR